MADAKARTTKSGLIMRTQTRFDLNNAVENWRNELAAQPQLSADDRRELEKHLADAMTELRQRGLNEEEAFWLARRRIGQPQQLAEEFVKTNPGEVWRERIFWMLFGIFLFSVWGGLSSSILLKFNSGKEGVSLVGQIIFVFSNILPLLICVLLAKGKFLRPVSVLGWFTSSRKRFAVTAIIISGVASVFTALSMGIPFAAGWLAMAYWLFDIVFIGIIVWFMPKQTPKATETS